MHRSGCIWEVTPRSTGGGRKKAGGQAGETERAGPTERPPGTPGASTDPKPVSMHTLGRRPCRSVSLLGGGVYSPALLPAHRRPCAFCCSETNKTL